MAPGDCPEVYQDPICALQGEDLIVVEPATGKVQLIRLAASGCQIRSSVLPSFRVKSGPAAISLAVLQLTAPHMRPASA